MENQLNLFGEVKHEYQIIIVPSASFRYLLKQMQDSLLEYNPSVHLSKLHIEVGTVVLFEMDERNFIHQLHSKMNQIDSFILKQTSTSISKNKQKIKINLNAELFRERIVPTIQSIIGKSRANKTPSITLVDANSVINLDSCELNLRTNHSFEVREFIVTKQNSDIDYQEVTRISLRKQ